MYFWKVVWYGDNSFNNCALTIEIKNSYKTDDIQKKMTEAVSYIKRKLKVLISIDVNNDVCS